MRKIVILYSGGLDSFLLKKYAETEYPDTEIKCVYYKHGADAEVKEIERLPDFVEVRNVDWLGNNIRAMPKKDDPFAGAIYIPGRNLVFTVLAASQELPDEVWMGTVWDEDNDKATDKNENFRKGTSELLSYVLSPFLDSVKIRYPFVENGWSKEDCVNWALYTKAATKEEIINTVSCWHQKANEPCGQCKQCFKRYFVFLLNGFSEDYLVNPAFSRYGQELLIKYIDTYYNTESNLDINRDELNVICMIHKAMKFDTFPKPVKDYIRHYFPTFEKDFKII
jgi:7-cyano-7-deazaguanine synthase in queuosine biosynthesis